MRSACQSVSALVSGTLALAGFSQLS